MHQNICCVNFSDSNLLSEQMCFLVVSIGISTVVVGLSRASRFAGYRRAEIVVCVRQGQRTMLSRSTGLALLLGARGR